MMEDFEQELYEQPDYEVWETNRVYEDMEAERAEMEAEAEEAAYIATVKPLVEEVLSTMPDGTDAEMVEAVIGRMLNIQAVEATHAAHVADGTNHWFLCPLCDDEEPES